VFLYSKKPNTELQGPLLFLKVKAYQAKVNDIFALLIGEMKT